MKRNDIVLSEIRVLHVCEPNRAGAALAAFNLAKGLNSEGIYSVVYTTSGPLARWCRADDIDVLELPFNRRSPLSYLRSIKAIRRTIKSGAFTVVHAHSTFSGFLVRLARTPRFPAVIFQPQAWSFLALNGIRRSLAIGVERALARRTDLFICVSREELKSGTEVGIRCIPAAVIPNAIQFSSACETVKATKPSDPVVIGCIARLAPQKGLDVLLHAIACDRWPRPSTVEIIGEGPIRDALESLAQQLRVEDCVTFLGWDDTACARLSAWDLFVLPSRYEGAPLVLLEAADAGLPIVSTDVAGARALLGDDSAQIVPVEDPYALACAVENALADWPATVAAAARTRERAMITFGLDRQIEKVREIYESLTRGTL